VNDLNINDKLPKSVTKTKRYIKQDVHSIDKLEEMQEVINTQINRRKQQLFRSKTSYK
jgi:hypothetical protein